MYFICVYRWIFLVFQMFFFYRLIERFSSRWLFQNSMHSPTYYYNIIEHSVHRMNYADIDLVLIYFDLFSFYSFRYFLLLFGVIRMRTFFFDVFFSSFLCVVIYARDPHKIAIYYIYNTNTRWLLSCNILARMYKYTNKKTKSLKDVLFRDVDRLLYTFTHIHTHTAKIRLVLVIYRNPLKSLGDFSPFSRFGHFARLIFHHVNGQRVKKKHQQTNLFTFDNHCCISEHFIDFGWLECLTKNWRRATTKSITKTYSIKCRCLSIQFYMEYHSLTLYALLDTQGYRQNFQTWNATDLDKTIDCVELIRQI